MRTSRGKNEARRTRRAGQIPAVVYGAYKDPVSVSVNPREITKIIRSTTGYNTIFTLAIAGGETTPVMVVDQQVDPIKGTLLHADLKRIDLTKRIRVTVPVHTAGEAKGVKVQGGLLEVITRAIEIECLPDEIPEDFTVDVTELMIGQSKRASDVAPERLHETGERARYRDRPRGGPARRGSRPGRRSRRGCRPGRRHYRRRARSHQEGQEGRRGRRRQAEKEKGKKK